MKAYSIFDDFDEKAIRVLENASIDLTIHPKGFPRPDENEMKAILEDYDCVIIGTSQKIRPEMFEHINTKRLIATASVGVDHIKIWEEKRHLVKIINTPSANAESVAEYTTACMLSCCKRLIEGAGLYGEGKNNKYLFTKPEDIKGKIIGVIGAGSVAVCIMKYAKLLGMQIICWTAHREKHKNLVGTGIEFVSLDELVANADVISINLPNNDGTKNIVSSDMIAKMKSNAIFVSVSRKEVVDWKALFEKAVRNHNFYVCMDVDIDEDIVAALPHIPNILVTPHIGGGTVETRKRMFREVAQKIVEYSRINGL